MTAVAYAIPVRNPRTGEVDAHITPPSVEEIAAECRRLKKGQVGWAGGGLEARITALQSWKAQIDAHKDPLIAALTHDTGRSLESVVEVYGLTSMIDRWCARAPQLLKDTAPYPTSNPLLNVQQQVVPYELVGIISPWNFPLLLSLIDAVPALLAGCAVAVKPSEVTPRFAGPLMETVRATPELKDVLTYFVGAGETGAALIERVDALCFTGSVATGRKVAEAAARSFIPAFLELGGKDPAIVLESADVDYATSSVLWGATSNAGQSCQSIERVYVAEKIYDAFVEMISEKARALKLACEGGPIAPVISEKQIAILESHLEDAFTKGATALTGGKLERHGGGTWCRPTVLVNVNHDMKVMREETFGAIIPIMKFSNVDEAVRLANDTTFGLSAAVIAGDEEEALSVGHRLEAGAVSINDAALTAATQEAEKQSFKFSGMGGSRMGGASIKRFLRQKALIIKSGREPSPWWFEELSSG